MNTRPTYETLDAVQTGPFTLRQRRHDLDRARYNTKVVALPGAFDVNALIPATAVASIRKAFTLAKTSHDAWKSLRREGRFDVRQAPRLGNGAQDVFKRKTGKSTTRVKCSVLLDASGSMATNDAQIAHPTVPGQTVTVQRRVAAAVFGATIAKALGTVPTVDLDVYQHAAGSGHLNIKWRWSKGTPVAVFNGAISHIGAGGNADGHALYAITEKMRREIKRGEHGVILVVSDGLPSDYASNATAVGPERTAGQALIDAVAHARKNGIVVIAVAIDGSDQSVYYGKDGVIPFTGNWNALGTALARTIGSALARH